MISIVIPTFNRAGWLSAAISSVQAQTVGDWELIIVDDGSNDTTREAVERFDDPRILYLRQPRRGVSSARNQGIRKARHPWIALLDSDDRWQPTKLQEQLEALEREPEYLICHSDELWIRRGRRVNPRKIHRKYGGWIYPRCLPLCVVSPSSVLIHRSIFQEVGLFDENYPVCEDYELWLRIAAARPFLFLSQPLIIKYGGHPGQLSASRWGLDRYRVSALIKTFDSGRLSPLQRRWTAAEIVRKSNILAHGFARRGKLSAGLYYQELVRRWQAVEDGKGAWA